MSEETTKVEETKTEVTGTEEETKSTEKVLPQEEVNRLIAQAKSKGQEEGRKSVESKLETMLEERLQEKERLNKLSEKERKEEELTQREKKAVEREQAIALKELRADAVEEMTNKGIPVSFADFLVKNDAETTLATINDFKEKWDASIAEQLKVGARQQIPNDSTNFTATQTNQPKSIRDFANKNRIIKGD